MAMSPEERKKRKRDQARASYHRRKEATNARLREWRRTHPEAQVARHLRDRHGLTLEAYDLLVKAQNGRCAICGLPPRGGGAKGNHSRLHVDHDHETGRRRDLLCHQCNCGIGWFGEDITRLNAAINYLVRHKLRRAS